MARFIVIRGVPNSGKTCTMWMIYHMLSHLMKDGNCKHEFKLKHGTWFLFNEPHPMAFSNDKDAVDFMARVIVKGQKVGIISEGDEPTSLEKNIDSLITDGIDVIICCVRTRATKYSSLKMFIDKYAKNYLYKFISLSKWHTKTVSNINQMNVALQVINEL